MKKTLKIGIAVLIVGLVIGGGIVLYMLNMPHRDVQDTNTDYKLSSSELVTEYLDNSATANDKYLSEDGESKILEITGTVNKINEDFNGRKVVLLRNEEDKAGVSCSFTEETSINVANLKVGNKVAIKGVIRSGAAYDEDLELYEHVIMEKCDILNK